VTDRASADGDGGNEAAAKGEREGTDGDDGRITRRRMLFGGAGTVAAVGGGGAVYNTSLGYGEFGIGTNLLEQDLPPLLTERLSTEYDETISGTRVRFDGSTVTAGEDGGHSLSVAEDDREDAAELDRNLGLDGRLEELFVDLSAFHAGAYAFEFHEPEAFFGRFDGADARPGIVAAIRGDRDRTVDPDVVERFAGADPADPPALVEGLVAGFREHTSYDVPRYIAGSIEDNVLFGAYDLRQYFEGDVDFEALLENDGTGIFCWELVFRSMEALQALPPTEQAIPIATCYVSDVRHKHAFTGVLGAIREGGELRLPMTFLDYTHSTLYDDLHLTMLLGDGLAAYNSGHRADEIFW
jgi:hypothetical protein